jgi:thiol-disulfide isomerase/thioredoxin
MRKILFFLGLSLLATTAMAQLRGGLLPIDEAYKVTAEIKTPGSVTVHFVIAPDYYLYRGQMKFIAGKDTTLGEPKLPEGKQYNDPYLGQVETYHESVEATIPYMAAAGATSIHFVVGYQGCHEVEPKLCYPPHKKAFDVALAQSGPVAGPSSAPRARASDAKVKGASRYSGSPAARALLKKAKATRDSGNFDQAVIDYKKAVTLDPNFAKAQFEYLTAAPYQNSISLMYRSMKSPPKDQKEAMRKAREQDEIVSKGLVREYTALAAKHPDDAIYPWALGLIYVESDLALRESYCRKAVQIDAHFAQAYECLAQTASLRAEDAQALAYQRKAVELAPDDEDIAGSYAYMLESTGKGDDAEIKTLLGRFPDSQVIAMTLVDSAKKIKPESARIAALERLRKDAPASSKPVASLAAQSLYAIYIANDLPKAKALANSMAASAKGNKASTGPAAYMDKLWAARATYVAALIKAQDEIASGHAQSALATLKSVESQKDQDSDHRWYLMQARALAAGGKTADAFALLRDNFVAEPSDPVQKALLTYGAKLGKDDARIDGEVWTAFQAKTKPAPSFTLKRLDNGKPLSLSDYRGRVVIVDFWYPNCGPCNAAFPFLQKVASRFKDKGLTVLAINSIEDQQDFALPLLKGRGYDFIGLAGSEKFAQDVYGVDSYPSTFLIGADGKVYMRPTLYDDAHERSTELAVRMLLQHAKQ